jgi:hypothetical protein
MEKSRRRKQKHNSFPSLSFILMTKKISKNIGKLNLFQLEEFLILWNLRRRELMC